MKSHGYKTIGYIRLKHGKRLYITSIEIVTSDVEGEKQQQGYLLGYGDNNNKRKPYMLTVHVSPDKRLYVVVDGQKYYEEQWVRTTDWDK
jgi:hypothetical protein